jgi:ribosomal-protein-alanine N-acetyltransferase
LDSTFSIAIKGFEHRIEIRQAEKEDIETLALNEQNASGHPWSKRDLLSSFEGGHQIYCAISGGEILAHCVLSQVFDELEVLIFTVAKTWQGRGLGFAFLGSIIESHPNARFFLEVRESNSAAIGLYEKLLFAGQGRRKAYYRDTLEDALLMVREAKNASV